LSASDRSAYSPGITPFEPTSPDAQKSLDLKHAAHADALQDKSLRRNDMIMGPASLALDPTRSPEDHSTLTRTTDRGFNFSLL
jgi:hypothetical protein